MMRREATPPPGRTDWAAVRARIEALGATVRGDGQLAHEEIRMRLDARARALAAPLALAPAGESLELIVVDLASESYALESRFVLEMLPQVDVALIPGADPPMLGISAWRGELITLLDLRQALGLPGLAADASPQLVVLGEDRPAFGVLVDAVRDLRRVPTSAISAASKQAGRSEILQGITPEAVLVVDAVTLIRTHS